MNFLNYTTELPEELPILNGKRAYGKIRHLA